MGPVASFLFLLRVRTKIIVQQCSQAWARDPQEGKWMRIHEGVTKLRTRVDERTLLCVCLSVVRRRRGRNVSWIVRQYRFIIEHQMSR